jgi:DNA-binding response OmpR family regulator
MNSILLVDDEALVCTEFKQTLKGLGFYVEVADTAESALRCIEEKPFDVILVEFNLQTEHGAHPRAGKGLQLVRQLRALDVNTPVLMFTAMEGELYETASLDAGADDFISKTVSIPCLIARFRAHIRRHEKGLGKIAVPGRCRV